MIRKIIKSYNQLSKNLYFWVKRDKNMMFSGEAREIQDKTLEEAKEYDI